MPVQPAVSPRGGSKLATWLRREAVALLGVAGAVLTLLAELAHSMPMAPPVARLLAYWRGLTEALWRPPFELVGVPIHPNYAAALTIALFLITIGVGARISAARTAHPLPPISELRFWGTDDQTWPSLIAFAAVCLIILLGHSPGSGDRPQIFGSEKLGGWVFAIVGTAGYLLGEFIGGKDFHRRLIRAIAAVAVIAALNWALLASGAATSPGAPSRAASFLP